MSKTVWLVYNGQLNSVHYLWQISSFGESLSRYGYVPVIMSSHELLARFGTDDGMLFHTKPAEKPAFCIFYDKDIVLARTLEICGIPVINSSECIRICDDKALCALALQNAGLPIPLTFYGGKFYLGTEFHPLLDRAAAQLGWPLVVKGCYGSFGDQVYLVHDKDELLALLDQIGNKPFVLQKYISYSHGRDVRVVATKKRVIAAAIRENDHDFRSNVSAGGRMSRIELSPAMEKLALGAIRAVGAHFAGIDLLFRGADDYFVCEVNSNLHFHGIEKCCNIDIADQIARDLLPL